MIPPQKLKTFQLFNIDVTGHNHPKEIMRPFSTVFHDLEAQGNVTGATTTHAEHTKAVLSCLFIIFGALFVIFGVPMNNLYTTYNKFSVFNSHSIPNVIFCRIPNQRPVRVVHGAMFNCRVRPPSNNLDN